MQESAIFFLITKQKMATFHVWMCHDCRVNG